MKSRLKLLFKCTAILCTLTLIAATVPKPTIYLIGDSTVKNGKGKGDNDLWGWGDYLAMHVDTVRMAVRNRALGGRSSRTYLTEGHWEKVLAELKAGDFVLMQFGHNDGGSLDSGRARASLKGNGEDSKDVVLKATGKSETVHSYGWYLRKYISDAKNKGAIPIVLSLIPRNDWKEGRVVLAKDGYGRWASEAASQMKVAFVDLNGIVASHYDSLGVGKVKTFFPGDHTHTNRAGAELNATCVTEGLKHLTGNPVTSYLK